jgi:hypothetical protein
MLSTALLYLEIITARIGSYLIHYYKCGVATFKLIGENPRVGTSIRGLRTQVPAVNRKELLSSE